MNIRYVISHIDKDGMRSMTYAQQGRNTRGSKEEAEKLLQAFQKNNREELLAETYGPQSIGTFEVSAIQCYPTHHDPMGRYIKEELNPGQVCLVGEIKEILEEIDRKAEQWLIDSKN